MFLKYAMKVKVKSFSCSAVSDSLWPWTLYSMDCSLPGSSIYGIFQASILEWVATSFSGDLPNPGIKPRSPILQADALPSEPPGKPQCILLYIWLIKELMDKILFCKIKNYFLRVKRIKDKLWNEINYFQCMCLVRE